MKILIVSDIHGNYEALLAVAHAEEADEIWCLGDLVAFGPQPVESVQWVRHHARYCVRGNHDQAMVDGFDSGGGELLELAKVTRRFTEPLLTDEQVEFLRDLPLTSESEVEGSRFWLAHAWPDGQLNRAGLTPELSDEELAEAVKGINADFIFLGHTHLPMIREVGNKLLVNPGSVGLPLDGNWRASYAIWRDGKVKLRRTSYDVSKTIQSLSRCDLPREEAEHLSRILLSGSLDEESRKASALLSATRGIFTR